jgi:tRNA-dihydrouridine synthase A
MAQWDAQFYGDAAAREGISRESVEEQMVQYMEREAASKGTPWYAIARHMLGLRHGQPGARLWRQVWSDHRLKTLPARQVAQQAAQAWVRG